MAVTPMASEGFDASLFEVDEALMSDVSDSPDTPTAPAIDAVASATDTDPTRLRVQLPTEEDAARSAGQSILLRRTETLIGFLGSGRKVTQKGHLTLADARVLLPLLVVPQPLVRFDLDSMAQVRSSADVPAINVVVEVARRAKLVRVEKGHLASTKRGRLIGRDPLDDLGLLSKSLLSIGPATLLAPHGQSALPDATALFDKVADASIARLLVHGIDDRPDMSELVDFALAAVDESIERESYGWRDSFWREVVTAELRAAFDLLRTLGVVDWHEPSSVRLTPAGRWLAAQSAREAGIEVVALDERTIEISFEELVASSTSDDLEGFSSDSEAWRRARTDEHAATELVEAVERTGDPALCRFAMATLDALDRGVSEGPVRSLLDGPAKAAALVWLVDNGLEPRSSLLDADLEVLIDVLSWRMSSGVDGGCDAVLAEAGDVDAQVALTASLWRVLSPSTLAVLEHIGRTNDDKRVAKAARKAVVQHRSLLANS